MPDKYNVVVAAKACRKQGCRTVATQPCTLYSMLGLIHGAEHAVQQLVLMNKHKGEAGAYLQKGIALDIIPFMHEPASVAGNSFPQVLHCAARQSVQTCNFHFSTVYYDGIH